MEVVPSESIACSETVEYEDAMTGAILFGSKTVMQPQTSWANAVVMMSDIGFLATLRAFDGARINDETIELLYPYVATRLLPERT